MRMTIKSVLLAVMGLFSIANGAEPAQYLEYLQSSGSQYVDLGVKARSGLEVEVKVAYVNSAPDDDCLIGARAGNTRFYMVHVASACWGYGYNNFFNLGNSDRFFLSVPYTVNSILEAGNQTITVDGTVINAASSSGSYSLDYNLYLFGLNNGGSFQYPSSARIYSLKLWDRADGGRTQLLDLRPCKDANGIICFYDSVNDNYLYNAGSGEFTGAEYYSAEVDYYVEYLETDGTQWIDTEIYGQTGTRASVDFSFNEVPTGSAEACILGSRSANRIYYAYYYNNSFGWAHGDYVSLNPSVAAVAGQRYTVILDLFRDYRRMTVDGIQYAPLHASATTFRDNITLGIFALPRSGGVAEKNAKVKCYGVKIWRSFDGKRDSENILMADFRPCVDVNGEAGMFDTVSGRIFYKKTGNAFSVGPALSAEGGAVVTATPSEFDGTAEPAYGTHEPGEIGTSSEFSSAKYYVDPDGILYQCVGYTEETSEDGMYWSEKTAVTDSLVCNHTWTEGWWRITWQWEQVGYHVSLIHPAGAEFTVVSDVDTADLPEMCFYPGSKVTLSAGESAERSSFMCWYGDLDSYVCDTNRTVTVTVDSAKTLTAAYYHGWESGGITDGVETISNGVWTITVKDGVVQEFKEGFGVLDFANIETDLGYKITGFKNWSDRTHRGPVGVAYVNAPDATSVGELTFCDCLNLRSAKFNENITFLGRSTFYRCRNLSEIYPSVSKILSQVELTIAEGYIFNSCKALKVDVEIDRKDDFTVPALLFVDSGVKSVDMSKCSGNVTFATSLDGKEQSSGSFQECVNLTTFKMPQNLDCLPYGLFFDCSRLSELYFPGKIPAPENIGYFYGWNSNHLRIYISQKLNPGVVEDLQLREPTETEMAHANFPAEEYEEGRLLGVWDTPTSGWGTGDPDFRNMWVIDYTAPSSGGLLMFVR